MRYLHTMVRVKDLDASLRFYCEGLGLTEMYRMENDKGRFTLVFLAAPEDVELARERKAPMVELTYNWDPEDYQGGRNFGHLAYRVDDIYETCRRLMDMGVTINRPPPHPTFIGWNGVATYSPARAAGPCSACWARSTASIRWPRARPSGLSAR